MLICLPYDLKQIYPFYVRNYENITFDELLTLGYEDFVMKLNSIPKDEPLYEIIKSRAINLETIKDKVSSFIEKEYEILLAQNRFQYFDEQAMKDPMLVPVGMKHAGTDLFNQQNADIFAEYNKTSQKVDVTAFDFEAFTRASAELNIENLAGVEKFAFICPLDEAELRNNLKDTLQYVTAFATAGYVGTVAGVNIYTKKDAVAGTIVMGTKEAVTLFIKTGVEVEQDREPNTRENLVYTRKYYLPALTDETKAVKIVKGA